VTVAELPGRTLSLSRNFPKEESVDVEAVSFSNNEMLWQV